MAETLSKAGKNQEALTLLINSGQKAYGDAAEKNVTASQKFDVALANLKETIGMKLLPIIEKLIDFATKMIDAFDKQPKILQNVELAFLGIVAVGGPLLGFLASAKTAMVTLGIVSEGAAVGTNLLSVALKAIPIMAVIALIVLLITHWEDVQKAAKATWQAVSEWFSAIYDDIKKFMSSAIDWLKQNWPLILGVLTGPFGLFAVFLIKHKDEILQTLTDGWNAIKTTIGGIVDKTIKEIAGYWNTLRDYIAYLFTESANSIFNILKSGWTNVKDAVVKIVEELYAGLQIIWLKIVVAIVEFVGKLVTGTIDGFTSMKDRAIEQFNKLKDAASQIWGNIKGFITDVATNIKDKMGEVFGYMVEVGKDIARGIWQGLSSMTGWFSMLLKGWVNANIPFAVRKILGIASPSKVMAEIGQYAVEGLYQGMGIKGPVGIQMPQINVGGAGVGAPINITINAGLGTDPYTLGREITTVLQKYGKISSRTI
jgi:phage-related protein